MTFLDTPLMIADSILNFDIYHKPTNSSTYLNYNSFHPTHTQSNISVTLAKCVAGKALEIWNERLNELKLQWSWKEKILKIKLFQPTQNTEKQERLFTFTIIPNHRFQWSKCWKKNSFKKNLVTAKYNTNVIPASSKFFGLLHCKDRIYYKYN